MSQNHSTHDPQKIKEAYLKATEASEQFRFIQLLKNFEKMGVSSGLFVQRFTGRRITSSLAAFGRSSFRLAALASHEINRISGAGFQTIADVIARVSETSSQAPQQGDLVAEFTGNAMVTPEVYAALEQDRISFEDKLTRIQESISPNEIGPHPEIYFAYRDAPITHNLSVLFNPDGQADYMYCEDHVAQLTNDFKSHAFYRPESENQPTHTVMIFRQQANPTAVSPRHRSNGAAPEINPLTLMPTSP